MKIAQPAVSFHEEPVSTSFGRSLNEEVEIFVTLYQYFKWSHYQRFKSISTSKGFSLRCMGIQSESAFPSDPKFDQTDINYDTLPFKRICAGFGIDSSSDFRCQEGENHDLESVFIYISNLSQQLQTLIQEEGSSVTKVEKPSKEIWSTSWGMTSWKFRGNSTSSWQASQKVWHTPEWRDWISRLKHFSIAILNLKSIRKCKGFSSWLSRSGLDAIRKPDISGSVERFQFTFNGAKVRLNLAVSLGTQLIPSNLLLNTQSTVEYNNSLKRATADMKLGVNRSVNLEMRLVGVWQMNGGPSKIDRVNSQS